MFAMDASNNGMMLSHNIVKQDRRVHLEDIRRYVCHGVLREEDGWAREEEERTIRCKEEEEEDTKSRERRGVMVVMGEPHAWQGRQAWTRSLQIANVLQKEMRKTETMPRRGEEDPRETRGNLDCKGHAGATMMPAFKTFYF
jgi:hypothetical protein